MARLALRVVLGWPLYLFLNISGRHYEGWTKPLGPNHFDPNSPIFTKRERLEVGLIIIITITTRSTWVLQPR